MTINGTDDDLSGAACLKRPSGALAPTVEFLWHVDRFRCPPDGGMVERFERVLPDGGMQLVIRLRPGGLRLYPSIPHTKAALSLGEAVVNGARTESVVIDAMDAAATIGVAIRPGGTFALFGVAAHDLASRTVALDDLWPGVTVARLLDAVWSSPDAGSRFGAVERCLLERVVENRARLSQRSYWPRAEILGAAQSLADDPGASRIAEVSAALGLSRQHFARIFAESTGLPPKRFARMRRFQAALALTQGKGTVNWANVAADAGYFDQAHMIREFRALAGITPGRYLANRLDGRNHVSLAS